MKKRDGKWYGGIGIAVLAFGVWGMAASPAWAQQDPDTADPDTLGDDVEIPIDGDEELQGGSEVIVVTGSRILTDPLDAPAPVLQLSSEELERTGLTSVGDILQRLPASGGALNTKFNSSGNFGFPPDGGGIGAGAAQADLRYLGSKRVLVLVDGVRWINGSSASGVSSSTDLNTIPVNIIERIEVLEDGASPIYGSDAIAGVINIITKKQFSGVTANVYTGGFMYRGSNEVSARDGENIGTVLDGFTQQYDVTWGNRSDRTTTVLGVSLVDQNRISADDRSLARFPIPGVSSCTNNCSSATPFGRFSFTDPNTGEGVNITLNPDYEAFNAQGEYVAPLYDPSNPNGGGDYNGFDTSDRFNFSPFNLVVTPSRRLGVFSSVEHKILPQVTMVGRAVFTNRTSTNQAAPEPLFIGPGAANGNRLDTVSIDATNPYNPFGFTLDAATNPYFIGRRPVEAGPRIFRQNVNTFYTAGGARGDFQVGPTKLYWDTTVAYGINRADQIKNGAFNSAKIEKALGPLALCEADPTCVPLNIFGGEGTLTQEMLNYISFVQKDVSEQRLFDVTANISGEILDLPGGKLGVAAGVEHRLQKGLFQPDAVIVAGDSAGVPSSPTSGKFDVNEGYLEVRVPVVAKVPGADILEVNGAVRVSDYSTFGTESTFKAGARWRPIKDLMFRGTLAQGFRAPGIGELFGSIARFDQTMSDPCSDMLGNFGGTPAPEEIQQNCIALGVPADGSYQQINAQISVTTGGNRELEPETSDTLTAGLVYSPSWLNSSPWVGNLNLEFTFYRIELEGAIQALDAQVQLDSCVRNLDDTLCDGISRTPTGLISGFANQLTNIGSLTTSGFDTKLTYVSPRLPIGRLRGTWLSSFLNEFTQTIPSSDGFQDISREGTEIGDPEQAFPRFKSSFIVDWFWEDFSASWTARYIHSVVEPCRGLYATYPTLCSDPNPEDDSLSTNKLGATVYNDAKVTWTPSQLGSTIDFTLGVNNILNQSPPRCFSCALNGFDATTYDVPGMFGYFKAAMRLW